MNGDKGGPVRGTASSVRKGSLKALRDRHPRSGHVAAWLVGSGAGRDGMGFESPPPC